MERRDLIFRVFVSSTFSDLVVERNALQEHVFPRLREYCQKHGAQFQSIDLRWGISDEAALDQSTMRICRAEIARCQAVTPRPNFVVLLGDRHGWRPLPDEILAAEFEAFLPHLPAELANRWYKLDENAVCLLPDGNSLDKGLYVLQPRTGEYKDYDRWFDEVESPLGDAFRRAMRDVDLPVYARLKYEASATAQEIHDGLFSVPEAREHVVAFIRELHTADGQPLREALPHDATLKDFVDLKKGMHELDRESQNQLDVLKRQLNDRLGPEHVKTYTARWEGNGASTEYVQQLCEDVYGALEQLISAQIARHSAMPPLEEERLRHQEFSQRRARDFTGQVVPLAEIERYLSPTSEPTAPLVVHGASGSGKSALLAKAVADYQSHYAHHKLVFRFIGATANSTDPRSLLDGLCRELGECYGADNADLPLDLNKLTVVFHERLELATSEHPLALFLDALDQLQVADRPELSWLPDKLPLHVRLVVSAIPGPVLDSLISRLPSARLLELGPMRPEDAAELLQKWLQRACRRLIPEKQRQTIRAGLTRCSLPLYLRLAFEEAQRWRSYDQPPPPSPDVDGLIERLFHQLSNQLHHESLLVERSISYLRCSRHGLTEDEILDLLARDDEYWTHFKESAHHTLPVTDGQQTRHLPIVIWSRLYHDLEPYLSWRSADGTALMVFFHTRFNEVADRQFLRGPAIRRSRHESMAACFHAQDYFLESMEEQRARAKRLLPTPRPANARKAVELPWQRLEAAKLSGEWEEVEKLLIDLFFLEAKTEAGLIFDLARDFEQAVAMQPAGHSQHQILRLIAEALRRDIQFIAQHPTTVFQCMWNLCWWYDCPQAEMHYRQTERASMLGTPLVSSIAKLHEVMEKWHTMKQRYIPGFRWLRSLRPPELQLNTSMESMFHGHDHSVESIAWCPDGKAIASGSSDKTVRIWQPDTGECLDVLQHPYAVTQVSWSPDGRLLACGCADAVIYLWDFVQRKQIGILLDLQLEQRWEGLASLAWSPDGHQIAASYKDGFVCIWDILTTRVVKSLPQRSHRVWSVAWSPDGTRLATANVDHCVDVWQIPGGQLLDTLLGSTQYLACVQWSPDGRYIASGGGDGKIILWNARTGTRYNTFAGPSAVHCLTWLGKGDRLASSGLDGVVRVWNIQAKVLDQEYLGHSSAVNALSSSQCGNYLVSGSRDGGICLWNMSASRRNYSLRCETTGSSNASWSHDGKRIAVSGIGKSMGVFDLEKDVKYYELSGNTQNIERAQWSPKSEFLVSTDKDGMIYIWDINTRSRVHEYNEHDELNKIGWSPQGTYIFGCLKKSKVLRIWPFYPEIRYHPLDKTQNVDLATWSQDGERLAIETRDEGTWESTIRIMDAKSGKLLFTFPATVFGVSWSPDCRWILSVDPEEKVMSLWDGRNLRFLHATLPEKGKAIRKTAFSSDSMFVAMEDWAKGLQICVPATGEILASYSGHMVTLPNGSFAPFCVQQDTLAVSIGTLDGQPPFAHFPRPSGREIAEKGLSTEFSFRYWAVLAAPYFVLFRLEGALPDKVKSSNS